MVHVQSVCTNSCAAPNYSSYPLKAHATSSLDLPLHTTHCMGGGEGMGVGLAGGEGLGVGLGVGLAGGEGLGVGLATYLTVVGGGYILHGTETEFWSLEGVCSSSLVIQVAEVLRGDWGGGGDKVERKENMK